MSHVREITIPEKFIAESADGECYGISIEAALTDLKQRDLVAAQFCREMVQLVERYEALFEVTQSLQFKAHDATARAQFLQVFQEKTKG